MTVITFRQPPPTLLDLSPLLPGLDEAALGGTLLQLGNRRVPLGELAEVQAGEGTLVLRGTTSACERIGAGLRDGVIQVEGDVGGYLGLGMRGGRIEVNGSAGAYAASGLRDGLIRIAGDCGPFLGGALPGDMHGMAGGVVLVGGDAGERAGDRMRRGLVAIEGSVGAYAACRMIGGTILVRGGIGPYLAYAMRRGTVLLAQALAEPLPTFADNGCHDLPWIRLLARSFRELAGLDVALPTRVRRLTGDIAVGGKGEILIAG